MSQWNVAAAQYGLHSSDLWANIHHHLTFIERAANENVDLLVFPELSLTGTKLLNTSALPLDAPQLDPLQRAAVIHQLTIVVGLPLLCPQGNVMVGAVGFMPDGMRIACYRSSMPELDVEPAESSASTPVLGQSGRSFALGLSTGSDEESLPRSAAWMGADLYATGKLVSDISWQHEVSHLQRWAHKYHLPVLMANHTCQHNGYHSAGRSACWDEKGQLVVRADAGELLVIGRRSAQGWQGEVIPLG